jgi:hypothetical protein
VVEHLGQLDFLHARENVILLGPRGTRQGDQRSPRSDPGPSKGSRGRGQGSPHGTAPRHPLARDHRRRLDRPACVGACGALQDSHRGPKGCLASDASPTSATAAPAERHASSALSGPAWRSVATPLVELLPRWGVAGSSSALRGRSPSSPKHQPALESLEYESARRRMRAFRAHCREDVRRRAMLAGAGMRVLVVRGWRSRRSAD